MGTPNKTKKGWREDIYKRYKQPEIIIEQIEKGKQIFKNVHTEDLRQLKPGETLTIKTQ